MTATIDTYVGPAFTGWRCWRVLPHERLGATSTIRLCASGTHGLPKVWEPRAASRAVCAKFRTTHEAPWPDCDCGFYAYRTRADALDHLQTFVDGNNGNEALGWAFGRVSVWGRVVECEYGYRAEYAYPYELTVHAEDAALAGAVRAVYGVDAVAAPVLEPTPEEPDDDDNEDEEEERRTLSARLTSISQRLEDLSTPSSRLPRLPESLHFAIYVGRSFEETLDFIVSELWRTQLDLRDAQHNVPPVTSREVAEGIMRRAGATDYEASPRDAAELGYRLAQLAMRNRVGRARGPGGRTYWTWSSFPDGFVPEDPSAVFLERDIAMLLALGRAGGANEAVSASRIIRQLSETLGTPQVTSEWSGSFSRLGVRGWTTGAARTHRLTPLGEAVVQLGRPPIQWPSREEDDEHAIVYRELCAAVAAADGDAVTIEALRWRFRAWWDCVGGHMLAQRLLRLQRQGLVDGERRQGSTLISWRPLTVGGGGGGNA